jgi:RNA polymerase sigma-70 factor, ECF subfamily
MSRAVRIQLPSGSAAPVVPRDESFVHSFDRLYESHFDFVYRCLRRLGVAAAQAEDAAQDTFMVLHRRLSDLRPEASERGFLFGIASNVARGYRRKQARTNTTELPDEGPPAQSATNPFEEAASAQAARTLDRFLALLDDDQRAVFVLVELEGLTVPEISAALDVKLNTVYSRLRLARERFVRFLHAEGCLS